MFRHMAKFSAENAGLPGVTLIRPTRFGDQRGYFIEMGLVESQGLLAASADNGLARLAVFLPPRMAFQVNAA